MTFTKFDKAIVAVLGMLLLGLNAAAGQTVFSTEQQGWINLAIAVLTPIGVYMKANKSS